MSNGLHNRCKERAQKKRKCQAAFYERYYGVIKLMLKYLLECEYVPLMFENEHEVEYEAAELRKIWKSIFKLPYLSIRGITEGRAPIPYKIVYNRWKRFLKERLVHLRSLYLVEVIGCSMRDDVKINICELYSVHKEINECINTQVLSQAWVQNYNKQVDENLEEK